MDELQEKQGKRLQKLSVDPKNKQLLVIALKGQCLKPLVRFYLVFSLRF